MTGIINTTRTYLVVTEEDPGQVLYWLNAIKDCALDNVSKDVSKIGHPPTTTFRFPLPPYMTVVVECTEEG